MRPGGGPSRRCQGEPAASRPSPVIRRHPPGVGFVGCTLKPPFFVLWDGLLHASNVAGSAGEHGVDGVFSGLIIQTARIPVSNVEEKLCHFEELALGLKVAVELKVEVLILKVTRPPDGRILTKSKKLQEIKQQKL